MPTTESKAIFLTTAIDYTNGAPHFGHAYEKVLTDSLARYHRLAGREVFFLTGVDQHGQKVQQSAEKLGVEPAEFVKQVTAEFRALWKTLDISYDNWAATTDPDHIRCVQEILQHLYDDGQIYKATRAGFYSVRQEQFLTDKERGEDGHFGPEWGEVIELEEENYFFRLAEHRDWLLGLIDSRDELVTPDFRRGELRNAVERLTGDLCISRPKARLRWGIELPFDRDFVTYVWFDALINYISFAGYRVAGPSEEFASRWPALHVIGKDILVPAHGVYWPIMLRALGFGDEEIPRLLVHGFWEMGGSKMSKSLGNIVDPAGLAAQFGPTAVRFYLLSDIVIGRDADFSTERLVQRYNSDLANSLGNLLNRTLNMAQKYRQGILERPELDSAGLAPAATVAVASYTAAFERNDPRSAIEAIIGLATEANQYVDQTAPWKLAKSGEDAALDQVLYHLAECLRILSILLNPIVPEAARAIADQLGVASGSHTLSMASWGGLADGHHVSQPTPVFPRIEIPSET